MKYTEKELLDSLQVYGTDKLKQQILKNPELPILLVVAEDANPGEYSYSTVSGIACYPAEVTMYNDCWWEKSNFADKLHEDLSYSEEYEHLSDEEYKKEIDKLVETYAFIKVLLVRVG